MLTAEAVSNIMRKVLFTDDEIRGGIPDNIIKVEGLIRSFGFNSERVAAAKSEIDALLLQLPDAFQQSKGGGWTFLNGCMDRNTRQWGEQRNVEELVCLGIAVGSAQWIMKEFANDLPGGVPYFMVKIPTA